MALIGAPGWLESCRPRALTGQLVTRCFPVLETTDQEATLRELRGFAPHATIAFDPESLPPEALARLPGLRLGVLTGSALGSGVGAAAAALDRVVSFQPALTGRRAGRDRVWRAIPPPVADHLFAAVRPLHGPPRAMTLGRSTEQRERMLLPAKHEHDLLQVLHGVHGDALVQLLAEHDAGVYVPAVGEGFGPQAGIHLAAGQLLIASRLSPLHGLEPGIDHLAFESPEELVWLLRRLARFPEMHQRMRIRGRMKAEGYRASRLLARIVSDLEADVAVFGSSRTR